MCVKQIYVTRYKMFVPILLLPVSTITDGTAGKCNAGIVALSAGLNSSVFFGFGRGSGLGINLMSLSTRFSTASSLDMRNGVLEYGRPGFPSVS